MRRDGTAHLVVAEHTLGFGAGRQRQDVVWLPHYRFIAVADGSLSATADSQYGFMRSASPGVARQASRASSPREHSMRYACAAKCTPGGKGGLAL